VPSGNQATVQRVGAATSLVTPLVDGGFDPVPVAARAGDSLDVVVTDALNHVVKRLGFTVEAARAPIVVRTQPPPKKRDHPLNAAIVIVFSEPVAGSTLTPSSVQLLRGSTVVPGSVNLLQGTASAATFMPAAPLAANTDYHLVVRPTVRDLSGDHLPSETSVDFRTGTTVLGSVTRVSITVGDTIIEVPVGSSFQPTAIATDVEGDTVVGRPVTWTSTAPTVVSMSATGLVTALAEGYAFISAEVDGVIGQALVFVTAGSSVGSVTVTPESTRIAVGGTLSLIADIRDTTGSSAYYRLITWGTSNAALATVAPTGANSAVVTGVGIGIARITATVEGKSDTAVVAVGPFGTITNLVLSPDSPTVLLHLTRQLRAIGRDDQGFLNVIASTQVTWTSSNPTVASVPLGRVNGLRAGAVTITGSYGGHQATAKVSVASLSFATISASGVHACGVTTDSAAFCWGSNQYGQLGTGSPISGNPYVRDTVPVPVAGGLKFTTINVAELGSCGLANGGKAYCWGGAVWPDLPASSPVLVLGEQSFTQVSVGGQSVCALGMDSLAYCWGDNENGALGTGDSISSSTPRPVAGGLKFTVVSSGGAFACGLTPTGAAYCWGNNSLGELGTGDTVSSIPRPVAGGLSFAAIAAAWTHACGLDLQGVLYCWGFDQWVVGIGLTPIPALPGVTLRSISSSATAYVTCGLDLSGTAHCSAYGIGGSDPLTVAGGPFSTLSSGRYSHACAVTAQHVGYCWESSNYFGQIGNGTTTGSAVPIRIAGQP
jgi:uncharacterized protein YjdB